MIATENPPDFSQEGRPSRQTAGDNRGLCPAVALPVIALTPAMGGGKTTQEHPVLWFYSPYTGNQIHQAEFVLQNELREDIQRLSVKLPDRPGFTSLTLPVAIAVNQWYVWTLKLNCSAKTSATPFFVEGWIQRVATPAREEHPLWYDAIAQLATDCLKDPNNETLKRSWMDLWNTMMTEALNQGQREQLDRQPLVESLQTIANP